MPDEAGLLSYLQSNGKPVAIWSIAMPRQRENKFSAADVSRIIEMAWEDRTSFDAIRAQFGLTPAEVIDLMRREMKPSSFKMWRKRTAGRKTKHIGSC
jgi:uncharacterized protein (TIGR03643 family)